jgi:hypothetical protein
MKHWRYLKYVVRHKWFVLVAGRKTGAPLWRLLIHDWSKFSPAEWFPYVENFYGEKTDDAVEIANRKQAFRYAFLHHLHRNAHHWEHWVQPGKGIAQPMPERFIREMVADWMGAGRAITGRWEVHEWYSKNKPTINLHPVTAGRVQNLLDSVA